VTESRWNLLSEPVFSVARGPAPALSLPGVLAALSRDEPIEYAALQPHQFHAWHMFLVQLAVLALDEAGSDEPFAEETAWREALRALTEGQDEPWTLVVPDVSQPAFLQPPVPEGTVEKFKNTLLTPDELDLLFLKRNHDVKVRRMTRARPEHWAYALVSLQTMDGFGGAWTYGIFRMNGGYSSRPYLALVQGETWSARFLREVPVARDAWEGAVAPDSLYGYSSAGHRLSWLPPWDGTGSLPLSECSPAVIEICRRVRLVAVGREVVVRTQPTKVPRIAGADLKGNTGDPWNPVRVEKGTGLSVPGRGFHYQLLQSIVLGGDYRRNPALRPREADGRELVLDACVLARGQGKTNGLHTRSVPVPGHVRLALASETGARKLADAARRMIELTALVQSKILLRALNVLYRARSAGDPSRRRSREVNRHDAEVDDIFFPRLWELAEFDEKERDIRWTREMLELAERELERAISRAPIPEARRYRAVAEATSMFYALRHKHCSFAYEVEGS